MTLSEMQDEVRARGFDYLDDIRIATLVVQAIAWVMCADYWPWRVLQDAGVSDIPDLDTRGGTVTLTYTDLGPIISVMLTDASFVPIRELTPRDVHDLRTQLPGGADEPMYYTVRRTGGVPVLTIWPVTSAQNVTVNYYRDPDLFDPTAMVAAMPMQLHYVVVDRAVCMAYRDADNHASASALQTDIDATLQQYRMDVNDTTPTFITRTECW